MDNLKPINVSGRAKSPVKVTALNEGGVRAISRWVRREAGSNARLGTDDSTTVDLVRASLLGVIAINAMAAGKPDGGYAGPFNPVIAKIASMLSSAVEVVGGREIRRFIIIDDTIKSEIVATYPSLEGVEFGSVDVTDYLNHKEQVLTKIDDDWLATAYECNQTVNLAENGNARVLTSYVDSEYAYSTEGLTSEELTVAKALGLQGPGKAMYADGFAQRYSVVVA